MKKIPLSQGKFALIDDSDHEAVSQFKWCASRGGCGFYAVRGVRKPDGTRTIQRLHRFLLPGIPEIDHRDGDGLNNQRSNLRAASHKENGGNRRKHILGSSKFKGVVLERSTGRWKAVIRRGGKQTHLGTFVTEREAALIYDEAARLEWGEFARANFP